MDARENYGEVFLRVSGDSLTQSNGLPDALTICR